MPALSPPVFVTGATGRVGSDVCRLLAESGVRVRAALTDPTRAISGPWQEAVRFSFTDPTTWQPAFTNVERLFLMRPPQIGNVRRDMLPALEAARAAGVRRIVFLSLQGADRIPVAPHRVVEQWLEHSGLAWTFVRAAFFMENLTTVMAAEIRDQDEIVVPVGNGRTAFVAARDVAAVAAIALRTEGHAGRAYTPTGPTALTYRQVAAMLSEVLGRHIRYTAPGPFAYWRHARSGAMSPGMAAITLAIYTAARLGLAAGLTEDVLRVTGSAPLSVPTFVAQHRAVWE